MYIYMASTLVHLLHKSGDAEGIMVEVDLDYIIPIVNRVINVENQLFMRKHPCIGEFYQFNLSSCIRQQNSLTAQFVSFSLSNLANIFYPPQFLQ